MENAGVLTGVYEVMIGVPELEQAARHWAAFGYRPGARGRLSASAADALYGVPSALESLRLEHQGANSGLVRLMHWDRPLGPGLAMAPLRVTGCRWSVQRTEQLLALWNHVEILLARGAEIRSDGPLLNARTTGSAAKAEPLRRPFPASRNLQLFQPLFQQVVMQRFAIDVRRYGTINEESLLKTSEICHVAVVTRDSTSVDFYDQVLGFRRGSSLTVEYNPDSVATTMFELAPGETLTEINFENPRSGQAAGEILAGRLRAFLLESPQAEIDLRDQSRPGHLGYCCYSSQVTSVEAACGAVAAGRANDVTPVATNEFGESSFCFRAPDGYAWTLLQPPPG